MRTTAGAGRGPRATTACRWRQRVVPRHAGRRGQRVLPRLMAGMKATDTERLSRRHVMPSKSANVKNEKQYEALKDKGMSKERAAKISNSPGASSRGGKKSGSGSSPKQGGTTAQKKEAGRKGGKATAKKSS